MKQITISQECQAEVEEKKSLFIAHLLPYADFSACLKQLRAKHSKANHFVTAFRYVNDQDQIVEGSSDDGEPRGTSGPPSLKALSGASLVDVGLVTVRYFGGVKLGTGGLARAYAAAANTAIQAARLQKLLSPWLRYKETELRASYQDSSRLEREVADKGWQILERHFDETGVMLKVRMAE